MFAEGVVGIDSARPVDSTRAVASGSRLQVRYSAGAATDPGHPSHGLNAGKLCGQGEIAAIVASGQDFLANDEWYETRTTEGTQAAAHDAPVVLEFWQSRGLAKGATVMLNLDAAPDLSKLASIQAYVDEFNRRLDGYYLADGFYAGVPMLAALAKSGHCRHGWIPEAAGWSTANTALDPGYAPPAKTAWDLWWPLRTQVEPAAAFLRGLLGDCGLVSCLWQDGNKWFSGAADEDVLIIPGPLGTHLEASGQQPTTAPAPVSEPVVAPVAHPVPPQPVHAPAATRSPHHGAPWPGRALHFGPSDHFGNVNGPSTSHGGWFADEQPYVRMIQRQLIYGGFVPGVHNPDSGWADGIFDTRGHGRTGPTTQAVTRFQRKLRPHSTTRFGEVWADDWATLFAL